MTTFGLVLIHGYLLYASVNVSSIDKVHQCKAEVAFYNWRHFASSICMISFSSDFVGKAREISSSVENYIPVGFPGNFPKKWMMACSLVVQDSTLLGRNRVRSCRSLEGLREVAGPVIVSHCSGWLCGLCQDWSLLYRNSEWIVGRTRKLELSSTKCLCN